MKTVLIIGPCFSPSSYPPSQRIRLFSNHLEEFGWKPLVLTVEPEYLEEEPDWEYTHLILKNMEIIRTKAFSAKWTRKFGIGDLGIRSFLFQLKAARRICRQRKIDIVFIPGPPWHTFLIGPKLKKEFDIPYVLDYIDPWVMSLGENDPPWTKAYWFRKMAIFLEPYAVRQADHIVAVSDGTNEDIRKRYPFLSQDIFTGIPYGGELADFERAKAYPKQNSFFSSDNGYYNFVYIGAMLPKAYDTLRAFFRAVLQIGETQADLFRRLRFYFIGTTYAANPDRKLIQPLAEEMGLGGIVYEHPKRIPYFDAVNLLCQTDVIIVLGTTETHYTASKIYPCIMADKPILAMFHRASSVVEVMTSTNAGELITYDSKETVEFRVDEIRRAILKMLSIGYTKPAVNWPAFEKYSARNMTHRLAEIFNYVTSSRGVA